MPDYTPHTDDEIEAMLAFLGLGSIDELYRTVPEAIRLASGLSLADGLPEPDVMAHIEDLADRNRPVGRDLVCFCGGGAYDHEVPAVVRSLAFRSEFVTSYTPYQPEVAQGVLQALFEFQTLIARLSGMPVANASLYDGAASLVEAVNLSVAASGRGNVWVSSGVDPSWRSVLKTFAQGTGHRIHDVALAGGLTQWDDSVGQISEGQEPGVLVVACPNFLGCLEDIAQARAICDRFKALLVVCFDPVCAGILKSPGDWGADVAVGEGQPLGTALSFGGPYLGLFACTLGHVRRMPGRLVGETVDADDRRAYVTTLRAREQDIRREKATSNVCTNQTLMAVTAAVQLGWLGSAGLEEIAIRSARAAAYCRQNLLAIDGIEAISDAPIVREFGIRLPIDSETVVDRMVDAGFLCGIPLDPALTDGRDGGLLIALTERRTKKEIDSFVSAMDKAIR
jgi:glycine dehydrogenase subunit 1